MIAFLIDFLLMSGILVGLTKAYYELSILNQHPYTTAAIGIIIVIILACMFPKIIKFLIKMAIFYTAFYFISNMIGCDLFVLKSGSPTSTQVSEKIADNINGAISKVQGAVEKSRTFTATAPTVVSGSRLKIGDETVQLYGIDTPDMEQFCKSRFGNDYKCGEVSQRELQNFIKNNKVSCESKGRNNRGDILATCDVNGDDLAGLMVHAGWAVADRSVTNMYVGEEKIAHDKKMGLWAGKFHAPWAWRSKNSSGIGGSKTSGDSSEGTPFQKIMGFFKK